MSDSYLEAKNRFDENRSLLNRASDLATLNLCAGLSKLAQGLQEDMAMIERELADIKRAVQDSQ
jgi:hypothetical protein